MPTPSPDQMWAATTGCGPRARATDFAKHGFHERDLFVLWILHVLGHRDGNQFAIGERRECSSLL